MVLGDGTLFDCNPKQQVRFNRFQSDTFTGYHRGKISLQDPASLNKMGVTKVLPFTHNHYFLEHQLVTADCSGAPWLVSSGATDNGDRLLRAKPMRPCLEWYTNPDVEKVWGHLWILKGKFENYTTTVNYLKCGQTRLFAWPRMWLLLQSMPSNMLCIWPNYNISPT